MMKAKEIVKRAAVLLIGLFISAFGLAICVKGNLGISPIATLPNALHTVVPGITLGMFSTLQQCLFFVLTILMLRRKFQLYQLLILPASFLFGRFVDLGDFLLEPLVLPNYFVRLLFCLISCVIVGLGFSLILTSGIPLDANTAFLNALTRCTNRKYSNLKVLTDVLIVACAAAVGLIFLHRIVGIREGTIISALVIGQIAGFFNKRLTRMEQFFTRP